MNELLRRCWIPFLAIAISLVAERPANAETRPNILFILADDLAWSDLGCYGHPWHRTPNIDRLASQGMRLTSGYASAPICSASRASLMTGKTTARLGFEFVTKNEAGFQNIEGETLLRAPPFTLNLPLAETTIAEQLSGLGYQTAFFGKWHLNQHHGGYLGWSPTHGPRRQGFQTAVEDFGAHPYSWKKSTPDPIEIDGRYAADSLVESVCEYLSKDQSGPFFAMASSFYVHTPVKTPCRWLTEYYDGVIPKDAPNRSKRVTYAAFVQTLDHHVGQMLNALRRSGRERNTLVVFMSDNGGHPEYAANAPLRGSKWNLYEGGVRVPMIVRWPGKVAAESVTDVPAIGYDWLPTFSAIAGSKPRDLDGMDLTNVLLGQTSSTDRDLLWHFPYYHPERGYKDAKETIGIDDFRVSKTRPQSALRRGKHKLLWFAENDRAELYDLESDPGEQSDLSQTNPELTKKLRQALQSALARSKARMATRRAVRPAGAADKLQ